MVTLVLLPLSISYLRVHTRATLPWQIVVNNNRKQLCKCSCTRCDITHCYTQGNRSKYSNPRISIFSSRISNGIEKNCLLSIPVQCNVSKIKRYSLLCSVEFYFVERFTYYFKRPTELVYAQCKIILHFVFQQAIRLRYRETFATLFFLWLFGLHFLYV